METLQRTANRGSISTGGYEIDNSCKFEADNSEWFSKTTGSDWNRVKWTASFWVKRSELGTNVRFFAASDPNYDFRVRFQGTGDTLAFYNSDSTGLSSQNSTAVFRDTSAWYHIVAVWDTANSTAGNRQRLYVNGVEVTDFATDTQPGLNQKSVWGKTDDGSGTVTMGIGAQYNFYSGFVQGYIGYMAEWHWVEGEALAPTDFGEFDDDSGIWKPKEYTGSYGTNGFYLDFENASDLGADASGNGNNWTKNNITSANQATDTPTNNFCTLNPLSAGGNQGNVITEGATKVVIENSGQQVAVGTIAVTKGKWYWEAKHTSGTYQLAGIISADSRVSGNGGVADSSVAGSDAIALYRVNGQVFYNGTGTAFDTNSYADGDIIGVALDMDNGTCALYEDGVLMGNAGSNDIVAKSGHASLTGAWTAMYSDGTNGTFNITYEVNFGGYHTYTISSGNTDENGYGTFEYAPPSGYYALCTKNLAEYG